MFIMYNHDQISTVYIHRSIILFIPNGECYNYQDHIDELKKHGHIITSRTDTEALIHGYEQWGIEKLLHRLNGMFAFSIFYLMPYSVHASQGPPGSKKACEAIWLSTQIYK